MPTQNEIVAVLKALKRRFPNPGAMEIGGEPYRVLAAVMLSARTRDEQVLKLLPGFFKAFPTVVNLAEATLPGIRSRIDTIGMYRQKARNLKRMAQMVVGTYGGHVPRAMEELVLLPGVGRKTASVVLASCFGRPTIAVDTHVHRVTNRLGWVRTATPEKTEAALLRLVPSRVMRLVNQVFVKFGRYVCIPGRPRCWMCPVRERCVYGNKNLISPRGADEIQADIVCRESQLEALRQTLLYGKY